MSKEDDISEIYANLAKKLKELTSEMNETEKIQAALLARFMTTLKSDQDHEGKQIFFIEDYKRRN
jgi:5'-3' exonuclease